MCGVSQLLAWEIGGGIDEAQKRIKESGDSRRVPSQAPSAVTDDLHVSYRQLSMFPGSAPDMDSRAPTRLSQWF